MKRTRNTSHLTVYRPRQPSYPNAADTGYFARKLLDVVTSVISGMGFITAMLFLLSLA